MSLLPVSEREKSFGVHTHATIQGDLKGFSDMAFVRVITYSANCSGPLQNLTVHPVSNCTLTTASWQSNQLTSGALEEGSAEVEAVPRTCLRNCWFVLVFLFLKSR